MEPVIKPRPKPKVRDVFERPVPKVRPVPVLEQEMVDLPEGDSYMIFIDLPEELRCSKDIFKELISICPVEHGQIRMFGKYIDVPRFQKSYGESYKFSGVENIGEEIDNPYIQKLLDWVCLHSGKKYTQVLINWYMEPEHYISEHSDNEKELVKDSDIYSFSFSEEKNSGRDFVIRSKSDKTYRKTFPMRNNTLIIMGGQMQSYYKHGVPKRKNVKPRINVTMRLYK